MHPSPKPKCYNMQHMYRVTTIIAVLACVPLSAMSQESKPAPDKKTGDAKQPEKKPVKTRVLKASSRSPQIKPLELKIPMTWKELKTGGSLRAATVEIPAAKGDKEKGELTVFIFRPQSIGQNLDRWVGQFKPMGRKSKIVKGKRNSKESADYYLAELSGTFKKSIGPPIMGKTKDMPNYRMLGILIPSKNAMYVLKLTGPDKTVAAQAKAIRTAIGADMKTEKKYESK